MKNKLPNSQENTSEVDKHIELKKFLEFAEINSKQRKDSSNDTNARIDKIIENYFNEDY